jgi:hypothetical protein
MTHKTQKKGRKESESSVGEQTASSHDCSMTHPMLYRNKIETKENTKNNYE